MSFEEQVKDAINTLVDLCAYYEGANCNKCEAKELCDCNKPIDLLG